MKNSRLETIALHTLGNSLAEKSNDLIVISFESNAANGNLRVVSVSQGITQFGYEACDFADGTRVFKEIIHLEDRKRVLEEIVEFERKGLSEYKQAFRLISRSGAIHWVESRMSIMQLSSLGRFHHQGILTNISDTCMELYKAGEVQSSLLPCEVPQVNGLDIAAKGVPYDHVGGYFYDFFWNPDDSNSSVSIVVGDVSGHGFDSALLGARSIVVGDVSGHGFDSALLGARASGYLRMGGQKDTPVDMISFMNKALSCFCEKTGHFITLIHLTFANNRKSIEWERAGHDAAFLYVITTNPQRELKYVEG